MFFYIHTILFIMFSTWLVEIVFWWFSIMYLLL